MSDLKITVLGLGAMGSRMATLLLKAGYDVTVWNRTTAKTQPLVDQGAHMAQSPSTAVASADIVISMVRDDQASREVWIDSGVVASLKPQATAIESSTITVAWAQELAQICHHHQVSFLEAPVAGSRPQVEAAQLIYLVGGEAAVVAQAEPILKEMGATIHHTGAAGSGAAVKLAVNTLFSVQVAVMGELIGLLSCNGVEVARGLDVISATPVCSLAAKVAAEAMLAQRFAPLFPIELVEKDLRYALEAIPDWSPITKAAHSVYTEAHHHGYGNDNITSVIQLYTQLSQDVSQ